MTNLKKAQILSRHFGVYGYGNFDIEVHEVAELLSLLDKGNEKGVKIFYEQLEKARMG